MAESQVFCSQCGAANAGSGAFCQKCGARIEAASVSAALPTPMAPATAVPPAAVPVHYMPGIPNPYGGFWIRVLARLIDSALIGLVAVPLFVIISLPALIRIIHEAQRDREPQPELIAALVTSVLGFAVLALAGQWLYEALLTSSTWQGTVGKKLLSLKVTDENGNRISFARATGRFFAKLISQLILNIGFIMVAFTERKQGLHDLIAGTLVKKY